MKSRKKTEKINLLNQTHGKLYVVDEEKGKYKIARAVTWYCICECGNPVYVRTHQLTSGQARSCGCWTRNSHKKHDLTGQRFGMLTVICETEKKVCEKGGKKRGTKIQWSCQCDCGNITIGTTGSLRSGCKKSCGCLRGKTRRERAEREREEQRNQKKDKAKSILSDSWEISSS